MFSCAFEMVVDCIVLAVVFSNGKTKQRRSLETMIPSTLFDNDGNERKARVRVLGLKRVWSAVVW